MFFFFFELHTDSAVMRCEICMKCNSELSCTELKRRSSEPRMRLCLLFLDAGEQLGSRLPRPSARSLRLLLLAAHFRRWE